VNRYPDSEVPFRYLGWYLVTTGNWSELAFLTDRGRNQREPDILGLYDGFLAARSEDWETAAAEFSRASPRLWEASFNAGLAALASTAVSRAREYFGEALDRLEASTLPVEEQTRNRQRSTVLLFDALAYGVQGSYEEAYRRASRAAELDPQSVRARYLVTRFAERLE
jgi:tetratricopeptide (TPR) repeat protein